MVAVACTAARPLATRAMVGAKQQASIASKPAAARQFLPARPSVKVQRRAAVQPQASAMQVAEIAGEAGFIFGVSGVMVGITLIGLAVGFVLLRVESLTEEGKI